MSRFYIKPSSVKGANLYISGDEAHHILNVMRLKKGDKITTFDGEGNEYDGIIKDTTVKGLIVEIQNTKDIKMIEKIDITLAQAIPKKAKIDFIVEKATELGVNGIIPIYTLRTIVRFDKSEGNAKNERWRKIAISASKQCGNIRIPEISPVKSFSDVLKTIKNYDLAIMACLYKDTQDIKTVIRGFKGKKIIVFIGPEGDFTEEEIKSAKEEGSKLVSLGPRILKVDTASINILSILQYELG